MNKINIYSRIREIAVNSAIVIGSVGAIIYGLNKLPCQITPLHQSHINNDSIPDYLTIRTVDDMVMSVDRMKLTAQERFEKTCQLCFIDGKNMNITEELNGEKKYTTKSPYINPIPNAYLKDIPIEWLKLEVRNIDEKNNDLDVIIKTLTNEGNPFGPIDTIYDINSKIRQDMRP